MELLSAGLFIATTALSIWLFYRSTSSSLSFAVVVLCWILLQTLLYAKGFYRVTDTLPPRGMLLFLPPVVLIAALFIVPKGRRFPDTLDPAALTLVHVVRIPVEIVLYLLLLEGKVPRLMTFAGGNFDIFSGLTAGFVYYFAFRKKTMGKAGLAAWNLVCLGLLANVVVHALLSAPTRLQRFGFDMPNVAIFEWPYLYLPAVVVPLVLLSHLAVLRGIFVSGKKP